MRIHSKYFPPDIREIYHIDGIIAEDGYVYIKTIKGMYVFKEVASIAYDQLISHMDPHVYYSAPLATGLWAHKNRITKNFRCVDDFGIRYFNKYGADHLLGYFKKHYKILTN